VWPAQGPITSFMSPEHPEGIDIGLENSATREIRAAAGGTVTHAGGDNDQPLGISIVIDHGNGITTTYGHLSELKVKEGDVVQIGQLIGIGGSTGVSTGPHLHFEVRKDGDTVDPLHVLPSTGDGDTTTFQIDCTTTPFTLPEGSQALIDFSGVLSDGEKVVAVDAQPKSGGPTLDYTIASSTEVKLSSPIDFNGPDGLDSYDLSVTVDNSTENHLLDCPFTVQRKEVPTTFYVRANPPASNVETPTDAEAAAATATEAVPTPTPTPNPWAGTPSYAVPTAAPSGSSGGGVQTPSYGVSTSGGAASKAPSYGIPGAGATPAQ
jgi:pyruvate/2-oxoglutarate dehydrogenase complex dihydrolipoamide acyltransferase (E2) component